MRTYEDIVKAFQNGIQVPYSLQSLIVAFDLKHESLKDRIQDFVKQDFLDDSEELSESFLLYLVKHTLPHSKIEKFLKIKATDHSFLWEELCLKHGIKKELTGTYYVSSKKHSLIKEEVFFENENDEILTGLRLIGDENEIVFEAKLKVGTFNHYESTLDLTSYKQNIKEVQTREAKFTQSLHEHAPLLKKAAGLAVTLGMALALTACGQPPVDGTGGGYGNTPPPSNNSPDCLLRKASFYDRLAQLRVGMNEEQVDLVLDPEYRLRKGNFKYSTSYEIEGFDYSIPGVVTCEAVQIHFDSQWKFRMYTVKTYPL